jgi:hypothetical protein
MSRARALPAMRLKRINDAGVTYRALGIVLSFRGLMGSDSTSTNHYQLESSSEQVRARNHQVGLSAKRRECSTIRLDRAGILAHSRTNRWDRSRARQGSARLVHPARRPSLSQLGSPFHFH